MPLFTENYTWVPPIHIDMLALRLECVHPSDILLLHIVFDEKHVGSLLISLILCNKNVPVSLIAAHPIFQILNVTLLRNCGLVIEITALTLFILLPSLRKLMKLTHLFLKDGGGMKRYK